MDADQLRVEKIECSQPQLEEVCSALRKGLTKHFEDSSVALVDCPDLTLPPYELASEGICGNPCVADVGGVCYMFPLTDPNKHYNTATIGGIVGHDRGLLIGAGAAPYNDIHCNAEWVCNTKLGTSRVLQNHLYSSDGSNIHKLSCDTTNFDLLGNIFVSDGSPGKVIEVKVNRRTSEEADFTALIRSCLADAFPGEVIALGGVFTIENGAARCHIMPPRYSDVPLTTVEDINKWLHFYNIPSPLTFVGAIITKDPGYDLRATHFHGYNSLTGQGGHYHNDMTPDTVAYKAYFNVATCIYRIDRPKSLQ